MDATSEVAVGEASTGDAGPDSSGSPDGGSGDGAGSVDGGGSDWCAIHHPGPFCEDFDEPSNTSVTAFLASWTTFSQNGATFSFDHTSVPSPPNALEVATTSTSKVSALVIHVMPKPPSPLTSQRLEFDLRIDSASNIGLASAAAFAAILFGDQVASGTVALSIAESLSGPVLSAVYLEPSDGGVPGYGSSNATSPFPTLGAWDGRFAIEITYGSSAAGACAQVYVGGQPQLSPCLALPDTLAHPTTTSIALGVYSGGAQSTGTVGLRFDDVTFDQQ